MLRACLITASLLHLLRADDPIIAAADGDDGEDARVEVVVLPGAPVSAAAAASSCAAGAATYRTADASGAAFLCCLTPARSPSGAVDAVTARLSRARAAVAAASAASAAAASASPAPDAACLLRRAGFWTFAVCGGAARQFHVESGAVSTDLSLGSHDAARDELVIDARGALQLRRHYVGGTDGRSSAVDWACAPSLVPPGGAEAAVVAVDEDVARRLYIFSVAARGAALCAALPSAAAALAPVNGSCARHVAGWWTYEACLGGAVRQWHDAGDRGRVQESLLGVYDARAGEALDDAAPGAPPALVQVFAGGSACDGGAARAASVRVACAPPDSAAAAAALAPWRILSVEEPRTCSYVVHAVAAAVCEHPSLAAAASREATGAARVVERERRVIERHRRIVPHAQPRHQRAHQCLM